MTMKIACVSVVLAVLALFAQDAAACGIEGKVTWEDGSKSNKTTTISTSWNSKKAFPSNGWYSLDLDSAACGQTITVYLDGNNGKRVTLPRSGKARVDFVAKASGWFRVPSAMPLQTSVFSLPLWQHRLHAVRW